MRNPPASRVEIRNPAIATAGEAPAPAPAESPFVRGCRRALQVVDGMLGVICALIVIAFLVAGLFWILGVLFGRRDGR
jgi:hypothetical protein